MNSASKANNRIVFLFGAGTSHAAGLPLGGEITGTVLSGIDVTRHTNGRYLLGPHSRPQSDASDGFLRRILLFLQLIKAEADIYYFLDRLVN